MTVQYFDVIMDVAYGDCGKGKISSHLASDPDLNYTHVCRYNGGANAGHTIFVNGKKIITHLIPSGVLHGIKSVIGPGCVVNPKAFLEELQTLEDAGIATKGLVFVAKSAHVVTEAHIAEEAAESIVGTTKRGIGPAYRDKYTRTGLRAENCDELKPYLIDIYEEFYGEDPCRILFEGAQGFYLDIDHGDYPYVTSSHVGVGGAINFGVPANKLREVWGAAKAYDTYVGAKQFEPLDNPVLNQFRVLGHEFGATTGRPRQCNYLNLDALKKACAMSGVTHLVISKMDILDLAGTWGIIIDGQTVFMRDSEEFRREIKRYFRDTEIFFSYTPDGI